MTAIPTPPPWHPRLVVATWLTAAVICVAAWWSFLRAARRWARGHR